MKTTNYYNLYIATNNTEAQSTHHANTWRNA